MARIHATAHRQSGLLTLDQLRGLGVPHSTAKSWSGAGRLRRVEPGVYLLAGVPLTWRSRLLAACLSSGGLASFRSSATLYGAPGFHPGPRDVTIPWDRQWRGDVRLHRTRNFDEIERRWIDGVPTVDPVQLCLDLAALTARHQLGLDVLEDAVDHLVRQGQLDEQALVRLAELARHRRAAGSGAVRRLAADYVDDDTESKLERELIGLVRRAGLPRPTGQYEIHDHDGAFLARVDHAWISERVVAEVDSVRHHLHRAAFEEDRRKRNRLRIAGWLVLELTARMIRRHPERVVRDLSDGLASRRPGSNPALRASPGCDGGG
jgi:predicted transcriptional regulator of viral defense system